MSIFNRYLKEGPGVEKDAPQKHRFFLFFELFGRKFTKLILLNVLYFLLLIPFIIGGFMTFSINPNIITDGAINVALIKTFPPIVFSGDIIGTIVFALSFIIAGPATAGFVYVIRNFQNQEHSWVRSDFFEQFKLNFKQGALVGIIDFVVLLAAFIALNFYIYIAKTISPDMVSMSPVLVGIVLMLSIIYLWMHYYIHLMMVTFDLSTNEIMKNALLFSVGKLPLNVLITFICGVIFLLAMFYIPTRITLILTVLILLSFVGYIITFSVYPTVEKYMIKGR